MSGGGAESEGADGGGTGNDPAPGTGDDTIGTVTVGDHLRARAGADLPDGVVAATYRVVGIDGGERARADDRTVTLLRVTDTDGRRRHAGDVVRIPRGRLAGALEPTGDPDAGLDAASVLRAVSRRATARRGPLAIGVGLALAGTVVEALALGLPADAIATAGLAVVVAVLVLPGGR